MGYWSQSEEGASFSGNGNMVWGDAPADIMGDAIDEIIAAFQRDLKRNPTKEEIIAGLKFSINIYDENMKLNTWGE